MGNLWTDEASDLAASLWREGFTGGQIVSALGAHGVKVSRNSVLGKLFRMGLVGASTIKRDTSLVSKRNCQRLRAQAKELRKLVACEKPRAATVKAKPQAVRPSVEAEALNVPFVELQPFMCRAVTDPTRFEQKFCGQVRGDGSPYCAVHAALHRGEQREQGR
jgi:hypothetical protein